MHDWVQRDLDTLAHEVGHAVAAVALGRQIVEVRAHRQQVEIGLDGRAAGNVGYVPHRDDPFGEATICYAGRTAAEGIHAPACTDDELRAAEWLPDRGDQQRARVEAFILLNRRDVRAAMRALAAELMDSGYVLFGPDTERIVNAELRRP